LISARVHRSTRVRVCSCGLTIGRGKLYIRLFGAAEAGDPVGELLLCPECINPIFINGANQKIVDAVEADDRLERVYLTHGAGRPNSRSIHVFLDEVAHGTPPELNELRLRWPECPGCGDLVAVHPLPDDCPQCGATLPVPPETCPRCGEKLRRVKPWPCQGCHFSPSRFLGEVPS